MALGLSGTRPHYVDTGHLVYATANGTLVRIQNFEQKLRVLANLDNAGSAGGIGPITDDGASGKICR